MPTLTQGKPTLEVSVDFAANPTAQYSDIHKTDDGVVSFWRLNSTSTLLDELSINNGVQISTPTTTAGPYPYDSDLATTFDGANDSAYVVSSTSLTTNSAFSFDFWLKVSSLPPATRDLIGKRGSWLFQLTAAGKLIFKLKDNTSSVTITSGTTVATGTYYHVTGVYDNANALLYVNGVLDTSSAYSSGIELGPQPIRFAADPFVTAPTWQSAQTATGTSTAPSVAKPASLASGELVVIHVTGHSSTTAPTVTVIPTGFTLLDSQPPGPNTFSQVYAKVAGGSEPATYDFTVDVSVNWNIAASRVTGQDAVQYLASVAYGDPETVSTTTFTTGAHIANAPNVLRMDFAYIRGAQTFTWDAGTERYDFQAGNAATLATASNPAESSITATATATGAGQIGAAHTLFIAGTGVTEVAVTLDDATYWNRALDADDVGRNYWSKDSGTPVWTNVTLEVRNLSVASAERRHELDSLVAGKMSMVLREVGDKDFDPGNTSSPYGPDIEQRVRVRATWNSTTYNVFRGYTDRWTPTRLDADKEEVEFEATDGFEGLALAPVEGTIPVGFSGAHISKVLNKALWPLADRSIDTGQYVLNGYTISPGTSALALLQEIADSERGICFVDAAGVFHFHDAAHRGSQTRSTTSQATFSDYPGGTGNLSATTEIRYQGIQPTRDKDKIVNIWTVSPDSDVFGAAAQTMIDHESRAKYFARGQTRSTRLATNADAAAQAGNLLTDTAFPVDRYESMTVIPLTVESYDKCFDLRISDRVTVKRGFTPGWPGASMSRDYFIEGKVVDMEADSPWRFTFVLTPVSSGNYYQTIMRDGPVSYWRLDALT